ncbi:MAG: hypothetical protein ABSC37_01775 [Xanthobacteraceae bacterium]
MWRLRHNTGKTYVGDNPAVLAIDLHNKAYQGGNRPVREVDREFSGSDGLAVERKVA